jgi:hypothetical protein
VGAFWRGIPPELLSWGTKELGPGAVAIETGTYLGDGAMLLSEYFIEVFTIEREVTLAKNAIKRFSEIKKVHVLTGSSREVLSDVIPNRDIPVLFWLDAHFSGGVTAGADDPCPLGFELTTICGARESKNTIILIDDIRGAVGANGWPSVVELCAIAHSNGYQGAIVDDVLVLAHKDSFSEVAAIAGNSRTFELAGKSYFWSLINKLLSIANIVVPPLAGIKRRLKF